MKNVEIIRKYIKDNLTEGNDQIMINTPLFTSGLLDSFHLVDLLVFLEESFKVKIRPDDIQLELIDSPEAIAKMVEGRIGARE